MKLFVLIMLLLLVTATGALAQTSTNPVIAYPGLSDAASSEMESAMILQWFIIVAASIAAIVLLCFAIISWRNIEASAFKRISLTGLTIILTLVVTQAWIGQPFETDAKPLCGFDRTEERIVEADFQDWEESGLPAEIVLTRLKAECRILLGIPEKRDIELGIQLFASQEPVPVPATRIKHIRTEAASEIRGYMYGQSEGYFTETINVQNRSWSIPDVTGGESVVMLGWTDNEAVRLVIPGTTWIRARLDNFEQAYHPDNLKNHHTYHRHNAVGRHWDSLTTLVYALVEKASGNVDNIVTLYEDSYKHGSELVFSGEATMIDKDAYFMDVISVDSAYEVPPHMSTNQEFNGTLAVLILSSLRDELMEPKKAEDPPVSQSL